MLKNKRAFTLVELMVAILILLIGVTSILSILPLAFNIQRNSKDVIMSEILARNAAAMLSARKVKYSDLRKGMSTADFDVFQPLDPLDYPGSTNFRVDGKSRRGNSLLYADTGRMAFPLPNGRAYLYNDSNKGTIDGKTRTHSTGRYRANFRYNVARLLKKKLDQTLDEVLITDRINDLEWFCSANTVAAIKSNLESNIGSPLSQAIIDNIESSVLTDALVDESYQAAHQQEVTLVSKSDFDERGPYYGTTSSSSASRDRSGHLWGYNNSANFMDTYTGSGDAPEYLWTLKDRSFPSLSKKKESKHDYYWVPLFFDADPRPGRFEWRAYIIVAIRYPGRNYKYQAQVHTDHATSVQAFAANPRDPDSVPRVTGLFMDLDGSGITGSTVQRYNGTSYQPLLWVYYPNWPDTSSTSTVQATVGRGYLPNYDNYLTPSTKEGQHGYVSGRFVPGDKFDITVNQPEFPKGDRDYQTYGWVLAGSTPSLMRKAHNYMGVDTSAIRHPVPYWESHYDPRNSSFKIWNWMSHSNGIGRLSVGRIMPVSGQVVDMSK